MHYQHIPPIMDLAQTKPLFLVILAIQLILVTIGLVRHARQLYQRVICKFQTWQILGVGLTLVLASAVVAVDLVSYSQEILISTTIQLVNLGNFALIAISIPYAWLAWAKEKLDLDLIKPRESAQNGKIDHFVLLAALWAMLLSGLLAVVSYQRHPHIQDEVAYLIQADFLAHGVLSVPAPPDETAFDIYLIQFNNDRWYPILPFGWPAMLALGTLIGVPWLVNPLLTGLSIIITYLVIQELYSRQIARLTVFLLCFSPWYIFMGMNFMNHMSTLFYMLLAVYAFLRAQSTGKIIWAVASGVSIGIVSLIRPLDGVIVAVLIGLWAVGRGERRLRIGSIVALIFSTALTAGLVLPFNQALTGDPLVFPVDAYMDQRFGINSYAYGFGPERGQGWHIDPNPGHTPLDAMINAELNTFSINIELFGWSTGSLWLAAIFILSFKYGKRDYLMLAVIISVFIAYFFDYFSGGPDFGARYWFLMIIPLVVLTGQRNANPGTKNKLREEWCLIFFREGANRRWPVMLDDIN